MSIVLAHNVIIIGTTISCVFSASCSNYAFHANVFSTQQSPQVTFAGQFRILLGKFPLGSKLIIGGVAIRMSWYAFCEKINSRGTSIPDWRVHIYLYIYIRSRRGLNVVCRDTNLLKEELATAMEDS